MRLNQFLANALGISRRNAEKLILAKQVQVNSRPVTALPTLIDPQKDTVSFKGKTLTLPQKLYLMLNKPAGYLCSRISQGNVPTIYRLIPQFAQLKYVGRLDKDSSGLLLLTNDGDFSQQLTHPKFANLKEYRVEVSPLPSPFKPITLPIALKILNQTIILPDGAKAWAAVKTVQAEKNNWGLSFLLKEGHKRQIRLMCRAVGLKVLSLKRIRLGELRLPDDLKEGESRLLKKEEAFKALEKYQGNP